MPRIGKRRRVAAGVYDDRTGRAGVVRVGVWTKEKRFPPNTPIATIREWQDRTRERLAGSGQPKVARRGSFAADVDTYLELVKHLAGWVSLRAELRAWVKALGDVVRYRIDAHDVLRVRNEWLAVGVKPKTVNNRVAALARLCHRLDGRRAGTPCDDVSPLPVHKTPPVMVTDATVRAVYERLIEREAAGLLRDAKTRARFMVLASTGKRPSELMRAEPGDVDLDRRIWLVRDGKGGFSPGAYLNDEMLTAWRTFIEAKAWGTFREGAYVRSLRAAGWPEGVRPYNLRHTVGMRMSEGGADLADIQQHLGHRRIETTRRHYVPVIGSRLQRMSENLEGRFGWTAAKPKAG